MKAALPCLVLGLVAASQEPAPAPAPLALGSWWAWLESPGGKLPFGLVFEDAGGLGAKLVNGAEEIAVTRVERSGDTLVLTLDPYDSSIQAGLDATGRRLSGEWVRRRGPEEWTRMRFAAEAAARGARRPTNLAFEFDDGAELVDFAGRWAVQFEHAEHQAVGIFEWGPGAELRGTFLTTLGDYRYLAGTHRGKGLELACFDGAHAFLFTAQLLADGSLKGEFYSRDAWHETFTARRDPAAALPDPFGLTRWNEEVRLGELAFPDTRGKERRLDDPAFAGKARILQLFGTWCPNCNDEAPFLADLQRRYGPRGLSIVGLAFELTGDFERDAQQVESYRTRHDLGFPLLVAGLADKAAASKAFPLLDLVRAYPTTIFLTGDGRVRAVHTGYSGPATGREHEKLRADFERLIEELLGRP
jgi:thiol-disulfide isomerase/thioredoxin